VTDKPDKPESTEVKPNPEAENAESLDRGEEPVTGSGTAAEADSELLDLQSALGEAEQELAAHQDAMLRMHAEMENLRKRLTRDLERSRKFALERVMRDLLPVRDSLERGLETDDGMATVESMKEGKALIKRMFDKVLADHGLQVVDPLGEPFDPELHEAMTMQHSGEYPENVVMEVMQKGFLLHERLIRPAMVVVSQGPETD
jgi:molecular chaperone GrpE